MATIRVEIDQFGQPSIKAEGFKGASCKLATASLEAAFKAGADRVITTNRPEIFTTTGPATITTGGK